MPDYAIITGHGRSGTNWLLNIMDASPLTHCRNEPNGALGSPLKALISEGRPGGTMSDFEATWDKAAHWTATHMGERDPIIVNPKRHVHRWSQTLGLTSLPIRTKSRRILKLFFPRFGRGEWKMPWWIGSQRKLEDACAILKVIQISDLATRVINNRPDVPVLHIVRHPGGVINSWRNRFVSRRDEKRVLQKNRDRLKQLGEFDKSWQDKFGEIDSLSLVETELWYWRYATELIETSGTKHEKYRRITYEVLAQDPVKYSKLVYELCGLPWTDSVEAIIRGNSNNSTSIAKTWHEKLTPEEKVAVETVLQGSLMQDWWAEFDG